MSFNETLAKVNTAYHRSTDISALASAYAKLCGLLEEKMLSEALRQNGEALKIRLGLKIKTLRFLENISLPPLYAAISAQKEGETTARERGYAKTVAVAAAVKTLLEGCLEVLTEAEGISARLIGAADGETCAELEKKVAVLARKAEGIEPQNPFGGEVAFAEAGKRLSAHILRLKTEISKAASEWAERACAPFLSDISLKYRTYEYFPLPDYDEGGKANAVILCTPFTDEARLYAVNAAGKTKVLEVAGGAIALNGPAFAGELFQYAENCGAALFISDIAKVAPNAISRLLKGAMRAGKRGFRTFICDNSGDGTLYARAAEIAAQDGDLSALDISAEYISVPPYSEVCRELQSKGIITAEDFYKVKNMPFAGYAGLNRIVRKFVSTGEKDCLSEGEKLSKVNLEAAKKYLSRVRAAYLLVDSGWGDFSDFEGKSPLRREFSYEGVGDEDLENIRAIVDGEESIFAKCGALARYCAARGDGSAWAAFTREEMAGRAELATKLVFRLLGVDITPQVEILDELSNGTAGGLCVDGGKRIQYRYACARDCGWLVRTIVHESFHALQSRLCAGGWSAWYFSNLGITRGRVERWKETHKNELYDPDTRSAVYKVHIYENDAYAFEADCAEACNARWDDITRFFNK